MNKPVVLITGALTGIGRATALAFAKDGARLVVSGRREAEGKALEAELRRLGAEAAFIQADVRRDDEVKQPGRQDRHRPSVPALLLITMPRKCPNYRQHSPNSHLRRQTILTNPHIATRPEPCAQIEQPWILRLRPRRLASRFQPGCPQPRRLREGSFPVDREHDAEASRPEPPHRS
jgi:short chain dehydrogenase